MKAIYPGTFDPVTNGHMDIIVRASSIFDHLIIAVADSKATNKNNVFSTKERLEMLSNAIESNAFLDKNKISIEFFSGLLINFAKKNDSNILVRGLRAVSDFEYELQMACINSKLSPNIQTIFMPASEQVHFISSSFIRQVASLGGDVSKMVPENVCEKLKKHYQDNK